MSMLARISLQPPLTLVVVWYVMRFGVPIAHSEGLQFESVRKTSEMHLGGSSTVRAGLTAAQISSLAIVRLAADPPAAVGKLQQRTCSWILRPFPLG